MVGVENLVPSVCDSLLMLMQLSPLCLGKDLPLSPPLLSLWPSNPAMHCLSPCLFEGYPCSHGELCLWLAVATCVSFDTTGLVAVKAQQHWLCLSLTACNGAPGPALSSSAHVAISLTAHLVCLYIPRACFPPYSTAY